MKIAEPSGLYLDCSPDFYRGPLEGVSRTIKAARHDAGVIFEEPGIAALRGRNQDSRKAGLPTQQMLETKADGTSNALTTVQKDNLVVLPDGRRIRVRKLTQLEYFRLMGFTDEEFDKARAALNLMFYNGRDRSGSQLYKQAGNSIVVDNLMAIFGTMKGDVAGQ